jgi:hypothetical protein
MSHRLYSGGISPARPHQVQLGMQSLSKLTAAADDGCHHAAAVKAIENVWGDRPAIVQSHYEFSGSHDPQRSRPWAKIGSAVHVGNTLNPNRPCEIAKHQVQRSKVVRLLAQRNIPIGSRAPRTVEDVRRAFNVVDTSVGWRRQHKRFFAEFTVERFDE